MKSLEKVFERRSTFNKLTLKKKLLTLKCKKNDKPDDHFLNFYMIVREIESIGNKMDSTDKVCHLLLSLNEDYESVITAIETLNSEITMDFVKSRLLDEEIKLKNKDVEKNLQRRCQNHKEVSFRAIVCYLLRKHRP